MATAAVPVDLEKQVIVLQEELRQLNAKRSAQQDILSALESEHPSIASQIAQGTMRVQEGTLHNQKIEQEKIKLTGFDNLIADVQAKFIPAKGELDRQKIAAAQAEEMAEVKNLKQEAKQILDDLTETLATAVTGPMARYTEVHRRLGKIIDSAARGVMTFPIPAPALAAKAARGALDRQLAGVIEPVRKLLR